MFDKRFIKELLEVVKITYQQVLWKWLALLTNISSTMLFCYLSVALIDQIHIQLINILFIFIKVLILHTFLLKKSDNLSYQVSYLVKIKQIY